MIEQSNPMIGITIIMKRNPKIVEVDCFTAFSSSLIKSRPIPATNTENADASFTTNVCKEKITLSFL